MLWCGRQQSIYSLKCAQYTSYRAESCSLWTTKSYGGQPESDYFKFISLIRTLALVPPSRLPDQSLFSTPETHCFKRSSAPETLLIFFDFGKCAQRKPFFQLFFFFFHRTLVSNQNNSFGRPYF